MGVAKAKDSVEGRNAFYAVFLHVKKQNRTFTILLPLVYNGSKEVKAMREQKYYLVFDEIERGIILRSLNELRNRLLSEGKYTDVVDELLIKFANAKKKKFKII